MPSRNRGKRKAGLRDINFGALSNEEMTTLSAVFKTDLHPITAGVLGGALVEQQLEVMLRRCFRRNDDDTWFEIVTERGPLSTFSLKIITGYALGLYDPTFKENLNVVRNIRNVFAHSRRLVDFSHPLIVKEFDKAQPIPGERKYFGFVKKNPSGPQSAYLSLCLLLVSAMIRKETKVLVSKANRLKRNASLTSQLARALRRQPGSKGTQGSNPKSTLARRTDDPSHEAPREPLRGLYGLGSILDHNKGK